jgi:hypothetical protein
MSSQLIKLISDNVCANIAQILNWSLPPSIALSTEMFMTFPTTPSVQKKESIMISNVCLTNVRNVVYWGWQASIQYLCNIRTDIVWDEFYQLWGHFLVKVYEIYPNLSFFCPFCCNSPINDFGIWNLQAAAIRASTYENFTGPKVNWPNLT